ncbi:putative MYND domain protein [Ilyonectria robusta]|uniref:putative MYND domain protein n=1 Tax=Ilyonectria robusta TaxID=1079257 RepID=UPI001E8E9A95|nr:putative MYND domain protein [Ilyonectria robusta]KAH8736380.1 putative MYND domain protein [Ilyonectria robusta]
MTPTPKLFNSTTPSKVPPCSHRSCGRVPAVENKEHRCLTCHVSYCSHGCRRSDSRRHGKICKQLAEGVERPDAWEPSMPCNEPRLSKWSPPKGLEAPISIPFTRLWLGTWLHGRPEQDVYRILVDTYRLRMDDVFVTTQKAEEDSIYSGRVTGLSGFHRFMGIAAAKEGLLPPWWNEDAARECGRIGLPAVGLPHYLLSAKISEKVVAGRYGDPTFATQLRIFGASVYGSYLKGLPGDVVLREMAYSESVANRFMFPYYGEV